MSFWSISVMGFPRLEPAFESLSPEKPVAENIEETQQGGNIKSLQEHIRC